MYFKCFGIISLYREKHILIQIFIQNIYKKNIWMFEKLKKLLYLITILLIKVENCFDNISTPDIKS